MIETSSVPPRKSLAIFGNLRQSSGNVRRRSSSRRNKFGKSSESSESVRQCSECRKKHRYLLNTRR